jgi:excisionase family DNA binding protein
MGVRAPDDAGTVRCRTQAARPASTEAFVEVTLSAAALLALAERVTPPARKALSPAEAATSLGVSRDFFDEHVKPELRLIRRGRLVLVPVRELDAWVERSASRTLGP